MSSIAPAGCHLFATMILDLAQDHHKKYNFSSHQIHVEAKGKSPSYKTPAINREFSPGLTLI